MHPINARVSPQHLPTVSEDPDGPLAERAADALRTFIGIRSPFACEEYSLRRRLRALCMEARRGNLPPQQLPLLFERVWRSLPEARNEQPTRRREILERVIAICVEENSHIS